MSRISGVGYYVPENVVTNDDLTKFMETSSDWILERAGIRERRWIRRGEESFDGMRNADLALRASTSALSNAGCAAQSIDAIIFATLSPDSEFSGSGAVLQEALGISRQIPIFEVRNQCSGFLYSLSAAQALVDGGLCQKVLVVGSEVHSSGLDVSTRGRNVAVLFGDGSGAAVVERSDSGQEGIKAIVLGSDGSFAEKLCVKAPGFATQSPISTGDFEGNSPAAFPFMEGRLVFKLASQKMPEMVRKVLELAGASLSELALIIPHQANQRIIDMLAHELKCPEKVFSNIARYGNTTAASIPIALCESIAQGRVKRGDLICLVSFGAGFSWGAALVRW